MARMRERLFAAILNGPSMNCRPHNSRQRIDWRQLERLKDVDPSEAFRALLTEPAAAKFVGRVPQPPEMPKSSSRFGKKAPPGESAAPPPSPASDSVAALPVSNPPTDAAPAAASGSQPTSDGVDEKTSRAVSDWLEQRRIFMKLSVLADEARTYENDTGVHALHVGFPLLSLPPAGGGGGFAGSRRVLAPIAFIPISLAVSSGSRLAAEFECWAADYDRVMPNAALLAWIEQQTGVKPPEFDEDPEGDEAWKEIAALVRYVCTALSLTPPPEFATDAMPDKLALVACPRTEELAGDAALILSAVAGLYPLANQGLIRDTQAMEKGEGLSGPVGPFLKVAESMDDPTARSTDRRDPQVAARPRFFDDERLVTRADPCQARAVRAAREARGLVLHGPPGTGKSQTITNIIGDYLAKGERVLFVCDKRTALDVVANRLRHLGLGDFCAVVHDPQRDQKELYRQLREHLEALPNIEPPTKCDAKLRKIDDELSKLHGDLREAYRDLHEPGQGGGPAFHDVVGRWLADRAAAGDVADALKSVEFRSTDLEAHALDLDDVFKRADRIAYATHPWPQAVGVQLTELLRQPSDARRQLLAAIVERAATADAAKPADFVAFDADRPMAAQGAARAELADRIAAAREKVSDGFRTTWLTRDGEAIRSVSAKLADAERQIALLQSGAADTELELASSGSHLSLAQLGAATLALREFIERSKKWHSFLTGTGKAAAAEVLKPLGLSPTPENAERAIRHFERGRARLVLQHVVDELLGQGPSAVPLPDRQLIETIAQHRVLFEPLTRVEPAELRGVGAATREALQPGTAAPRVDAILGGLRASASFARAAEAVEQAIDASNLFSDGWRRDTRLRLRGGASIASDLRALQATVDDLEDVCRVQERFARWPAALASAVKTVLARPGSADQKQAALRSAAAKSEIEQRIKANPRLATFDGGLIETALERYQKLNDQKRDVVIDLIRERWLTKQKERLLAGTGSRMNTVGADLKRRLTLRGKNALRLRQVLAQGERHEGGDPLFDLTPVWMASPETVAQLFPLREVFDVVVFDEASQCRLEEALPVLSRAKRVVIAGDPKQLPPTRFFESALAESDEQEIESEQDLFEVHQSGVEDLLDASLGLDIPQTYLDVHYRSTNADLIEFSNQHFYGRRLQALPGHPDRVHQSAPVQLHRADGLYEKRVNQKEAQDVAELVRKTLDRPKPPSIGVACFNIAQRDAIVEALELLAGDDEKFAKRLAEARTRSGAGSFEGLFVKNLENVQGDERDVIIISTTYGPDAKGRFYRRFGPLGMPGGGRRLNVLVTRARDEVHLVTSIPREAYQSLPPTPAGQAPGGGWLLFAYLKFAEELHAEYEALRNESQSGGGSNASARNGAAAAGESHTVETPRWRVNDAVERPSPLAAPLAAQLCPALLCEGVASWGNDGFCVDLALTRRAAEKQHTVGWLCDWNHYRAAEDPVDWEVYRTGILAGQGWKLQRLWSPIFVRDAERVRGQIRASLEGATQ